MAVEIDGTWLIVSNYRLLFLLELIISHREVRMLDAIVGGLWLGKSSIHVGFSSKPCLITGVKFGEFGFSIGLCHSG